jgi:hypothetical protein
MQAPSDTQATDQSVVRADPRARRLALLLLAGGTVAGVLVLGWILPWLLESLEEAADTGRVSYRAICIGFLVFVGAIALGVTAIGVSIARNGSRVIAAGRFPLPGARVVRDTRVQTGRAAMVVGRGQRVIGFLLIVLAAALFALSVYAIRLLA